jgi:hypothetical protein
MFMHPYATIVNAYVGPFGDDLLGHFPGPAAAVKAARAAGYRFVSIMYMNGNSETVDTRQK